MNSWCESCARKNQCYTADIRPKCYVAITSNDRTADRKTEPSGYKTKPVEDEPTISKMEQVDWKDQMYTEAVETMSCQECKHFRENMPCRPYIVGLECKYEPKDEPQTERSE